MIMIVLILGLTSSGAETMAPSPLPLIPGPQSWKPAEGFFLKKHWTPASLVLQLAESADELSPAEEIREPGAVDESYHLRILSDHWELSAKTRSGLFRGQQTVLQLLAAEGDSIPCGEIDDWPDFPWRGMLLDCGRHFMPLAKIKETLDQLALHKFNVLHWHLTEDQGWRLEVPGYPLLTEVAAWRKEPNGQRYGGFYTSDQVKEVVAYAAERFITVVPEIELPGHSQAALAAYPELSCTGSPLAVQTQWGIFKDVYCAGNDQTFRFLEDVLKHTMDLFPSRYIHIGGDECPKDRWRACSRCQDRMVQHGLADESELQSWFIRRIEKFLIANDRRLIGWDEILEGGLAPEATVQSWRGIRGAIAAARQGHDAIVSPTSHCYFDYDVATLDLRQVYTFDPRPQKLNDQESQHILGGEMNLWSEYIPPERLQNMLFPRLLAMAECLWTNSQTRNFPEFLQRMRPHLQQLKAAGLKPGPAARPIDALVEYLPDSGQTRINLTVDQDLLDALDGQVPELHHRELLRTEVPAFQPDLRVEDLVLPQVLPTDSLVPKNQILDWEKSPGKSDLLLVQLFLGEAPYGTPAMVERNNHLGVGRTPQLAQQPSSRYPGGGGLGLCNGLHGSRNFRDGLWSGFEGTDFDATVDLGKETDINRLAIRFYQGATAWVFLPQEVEFLVNLEDSGWQTVAFVGHDVSPLVQDRTIHEFAVDNLALKARKIRIIGRSLGTCPDWHPGAGKPCWVFTDEIVVE